MKYVRTTAAGTKVYLARKDSQGIKGTYRNIAHHAQSVEVLVKSLESSIEHIPFKEWIQAHNVHGFKTVDDRMLAFRPLFVKNTGGFIGLELRLITDVLRPVLYQYCDPAEAPEVLLLLRMQAKPQVKNMYAQLPQAERA